MRGTVVLPLIGNIENGITPAHAVNSKNSSDLSKVAWDHPRTCGEQEMCVRSWTWFQGSPPHMRGTVDFMEIITEQKGITPAHAGNS